MGCYVLDTTVLSNFAHVGQPHLIQRALGLHVFTTPVVMAELAMGVEAGHVPACDWEWLKILEPNEDTATLISEFQRVLDAGEAESLAVAIQKGCIFLSDDLAARRLASSRDVKVSGTLGILLKLVKMGELDLDEADRLLQGMMAKGYRSPVSTLFRLL
ncbi:MAG: DUF3368 domain-containing protein [Caldilineae bacterium]|nr:MAG: DUF3368 domain-containing protein [Caldilineae bacterium]